MVIKSKNFIIFNSIFISILNLNGFFGFNVDYINYKNNPNSFWTVTEFIGGHLATLTINDVFIGPFCVSLLIGLSLGYFLMNLPKLFMSRKNITGLNIVFIHFFIMFCWPIFIGMTNSLRQGTSVGFMFLFFGLFLNNKKNYFLIFVSFILLSFSHKMAQFFLPVILLSIFLSKVKNDNNHFLIILIQIFFSILVYSFLYFYGFLEHDDNYSTGLDLTYFIAILGFIGFTYIITKKDIDDQSFFLSIFYIGSFISSLFFIQNSILYERISWFNFILSLFLFFTFLENKLYISMRTTILFILASFTLFIHLRGNLIIS